jgi:hypothetical protein
MLELLESENVMVQYNASRFPLATGGGVTMPERSGPLVSVSIDQRPGWIIDLTESDGSGTVVRPPAPSPAVGLVIEGGGRGGRARRRRRSAGGGIDRRCDAGGRGGGGVGHRCAADLTFAIRQSNARGVGSPFTPWKASLPSPRLEQGGTK